MKAQLRTIQESVDIIANSCSKEKDGNETQTFSDSFITDLIPLSTDGLVKQLEEYAAKSLPNRSLLVTSLCFNLTDKYCSHLLIIQVKTLSRGISGSKTVKSATKRVMVKLLTDEYAETFNWIGSRGDKKAFDTFWLKQIVFGSRILRNLPVTV